MSEETKQIQIYGQPVHITLKQSAAGRYYWEISIHGDTVLDVTLQIAAADKELKGKYGGEQK